MQRPWRENFARRMLASFSLLLAFAVWTWPAAARCQDLSSSAGATEIWMSGKDVKITRRALLDGGLAEQCDDDEFARTMMTIAQQRIAAGDDKTATWLSQWAHRLTSGRVGVDALSENRPRRIELEFAAALEATDAAPPPPSAEPEVPAAPAPELPQSAAQEELVRAEFAFETSGWSTDAVSSQGDAGSETSVESYSAAALASVEQASHDAPPERWQAARQQQQPVSPAQPLTGDVDGTHARPHAAQAELTLGPIAIALVSFASGATFCAALCVVLTLVLVRARIERRAPPTGSTNIVPNLAETETRPATLVATKAHDSPAERNKRGKHGSIMESFYNHNVELYRQLAHSG